MAAGLLTSDAIPAGDDLAARKAAFWAQGEIKKWIPRPWDAAYQANTAHYSVKSNTSYPTAQFIGNLMELTAAKYRDVFGYRGAITRLPIHAYATREEYESLAVQGRMEPGSGGFYSPEGVGAIHLPYINGSTGLTPAVVLFHEGTHQFVHQAIDFRVPLLLRDKLPAEAQVLSSVPIWLNEGLATYMETAEYNGRELEVGRLNPGRLSDLWSMLKTKTNPPLRETISRRYGQPFSAQYYAVAWGVIFWLRHNGTSPDLATNRRKLTSYISACQNGFYRLPQSEFAQEFLATGALPADFQVQWNVRIGERSLAEFERLVVGPGRKLEQWEAEWAKWILRLNPRLPYGGASGGGEDSGLR